MCLSLMRGLPGNHRLRLAVVAFLRTSGAATPIEHNNWNEPREHLLPLYFRCVSDPPHARNVTFLSHKTCTLARAQFFGISLRIRSARLSFHNDLRTAEEC